MKLREDLAAGLPVVSTPLPEVARYDGFVRVADGVEMSVNGVETALADRSEAIARRCVEAMRAEAWDVRVAQMSATITDCRRRRS